MRRDKKAKPQNSALSRKVVWFVVSASFCLAQTASARTSLATAVDVKELEKTSPQTPQTQVISTAVNSGQTHNLLQAKSHKSFTHNSFISADVIEADKGEVITISPAEKSAEKSEASQTNNSDDPSVQKHWIIGKHQNHRLYYLDWLELFFQE